LSGVNRRIVISISIICLMMLFSACTRQFSDPYNIGSFDPESIAKAEISAAKAEGFASDLCVTEDGDLQSDGVNAEAFGFFAVSDKEVKSQKNVFEKVYPASTTKIMTCLLAIELSDPEEYVTVPKESEIDISGSSMADLKVGDRLKMKDMLYALMVPSGNDAAAAIAVHISGSIEEFAKLMNKRANELGATHTHFVNPHGLPDEDHYTTVYDMYLIFNETIKYPQFRQVSSTASYTAKVLNETASEKEREVTWTSGNGFYNGKYTLPDQLRFFAGKTGHTNAAGFCLVLGESSAEGKEFISIIMKSPIYEYLYDGMIRLTGKYSL